MVAEASRTTQARDGRLPLLLIFFLSGASGLVYEVVWSRSLVLVFGSTTYAVSTVLAAFMGGLALGSILVGRRGDRFGSPLKVYAALEVAIAALSVGVLVALPAMVPVYRLAWSVAGASPAVLNVLRFVLASLILLPPTTLMGATLPILSVHLERGLALRAAGARGPREAAGWGAGALYAANTFGAVAGAALSGFVLLPALGLTRAAMTAAGANVVAAVAALWLARATPGALVTTADETDAAPLRPPAPVEEAGAPFGVLLAVFAASGAGALVLEVAWTRILSLVLGSSTQAFSIMLTTFLAGLALGSAWATRRLTRIARPLQLFTLIELGAGLAAFGGIYLFPELPYAFLALYRAVGDSPALFQAGRFLIAGLVILPPTILLGACFPLAARAALSRGPSVAAPVAALYTSNTLGAIIGSCAAGFLLIPWVGLQSTLVAGCALNIASGAILIAAIPSLRPALRYSAAGLLLILLPGLAAGAPPWNSVVMSSGVFQYAPRYSGQFQSRRQFIDSYAQHAQLYYKEGATTTVSVEKRAERADNRVNIVLAVNGKVDASTVGDMETQVLLGQLPMLVGRAPRRVMVIGMGSGMSAGSALTHPLDRLAIVEIEPAILEAEKYFEEVNGRPLRDPRVEVRINDARNELLVSDETYDVIISEPSNPWLTGPSKLFTREFFELARSRLNPGGLLCQWVQLYGMDPDALRAVLRTYASVFPHQMVFKGSRGDLLVLGSDQAIRLDTARIASRMANPAVATDLARVKVHEMADLLARFRLAGDDIIFYVRDPNAPLNTDDNALVEFAATRSLYREDHQANDADLTVISASVVPHLDFPADGSQGDASSISAALAARLLKAGLLPRAMGLIDTALEKPVSAAGVRADLLALRGDLRSRMGDGDAAAASWQAALDIDPSSPRALQGLAARLVASGSPERAAALLKRAPTDPACRVALARARLSAGDPAGSLRALGEAAGSEEPEIVTQWHLTRGRSLAALGRHEAAARELELYFSIHPESPRPAETSIEAATVLARSYTAMGQSDRALAQYRVITGLADSLSTWNRQQALQALDRTDLTGARSFLEAALRWNHQDNAIHRMLARVLNDLSEHEAAVDVWRTLDADLKGDEEALRNIAALSLQRGRPQDAAAALRRLREIDEDPVSIERLDEEISRLESIREAATPAAR